MNEKTIKQIININFNIQEVTFSSSVYLAIRSIISDNLFSELGIIALIILVFLAAFSRVIVYINILRKELILSELKISISVNILLIVLVILIFESFFILPEKSIFHYLKF